mmetsp:Transcript_15909/g.31937  ORF Transcript_15909/g.31937 Transcript_15909/m.31937 type:complete len:117 (-) Transcript_15909:588-938(-)
MVTTPSRSGTHAPAPPASAPEPSPPPVPAPSRTEPTSAETDSEQDRFVHTACQKHACAIQGCLRRRNFRESACRAELDAFQQCLVQAKARWAAFAVPVPSDATDAGWLEGEPPGRR